VGPVTGVLNVKDPFAARVRASPPLFCRMTLAPCASPYSVPPILAVTALVVHATATDVTLAVAVPEPLVTTQVCAGFDG